jgi:hypothetical protein
MSLVTDPGTPCWVDGMRASPALRDGNRIAQGGAPRFVLLLDESGKRNPG